MLWTIPGFGHHKHIWRCPEETNLTGNYPEVALEISSGFTLTAAGLAAVSPVNYLHICPFSPSDIKVGSFSCKVIIIAHM